jgi:signal transduction histidine kinase
MQIRLDFPHEIGRLPKPVELGLFRVLQESLTNIHRHAGSSKAEMSMRISADQVVLTVRDHGKGMPRELLEIFIETARMLASAWRECGNACAS